MDDFRWERAAAGLLASLGLFASTALADTELPVVQPANAATRVAPLDSLRSRSAVERWHRLRERWKQAGSPEIAVDPIDSEPTTESLPEIAQPETIPVQPVSIQQIQREERPPDPLPEFNPFPEPEPDLPRRPEVTPGPFAPDAMMDDREILTPRDLKRITDILPFHDYEPDPEIRAKDSCENLCPRAEDCPLAEGDPPLCPDEPPLTDQMYAGRLLPESVFAYAAPNLFYNPLYFEDPQLERYGHTYHHLIQPFDSVGLFGLQLLGLPYQMTIDPMCKHIYPLGYYRPGECAPKLHYQVPWNTRAAINQAAVTTGAFFIFP